MDIFNEFPELTKRELYLKEVFLSSPKRNLDKPCSVDEVHDILDIAYDNMMTAKEFEDAHEYNFIDKNLDCSLVRHMRYNPATWHKHEFFEILYVIHGSCKNYFSDHPIQMHKGDICISAPGSSHAVSAFNDSDIMLNILIRKTTFERYFMGLMEEDDILSSFFYRALYQKNKIPYILFHSGNDSTLKYIIGRALKDFRGSRRFKRQFLNTCLSEFFIELLRSYEHTVETSDFKRNGLSENTVFLLRYIQQHYKDISLKDLSEFFNYSERQLQRILFKATGKNFMEIVQYQKMKSAEKMLTETNLSVEQICEESGYQSPNNFRRIFKNIHGITPHKFREINKNKQ
ncbi:MAG: AraC family transcriptional regulator [Lachnospiraceae bacterium]|nr:AraC family transcriptional regulator [Lachnospiraceae bacterium]